MIAGCRAAWHRQNRRGGPDHLQPLPQLPRTANASRHTLQPGTRLRMSRFPSGLRYYARDTFSFCVPRHTRSAVWKSEIRQWPSFILSRHLETSSSVCLFIDLFVCFWFLLIFYQALNQLFEKIMALDIDERHLLRLGHGEEALETEKDFSRSVLPIPQTLTVQKVRSLSKPFKGKRV